MENRNKIDMNATESVLYMDPSALVCWHNKLECKVNY